MPHEPTVTEIRLKNIIACLTPAVTLLNDLHDYFATPFAPVISSTTLALINAVQNVKRNKDECLQLMENIYRLLYAIINLYLKSEPAGTLPPATWHYIGKFTETLQKIDTYVEAQQATNKIRQFFRQGELRSLLKDCHAGLQQALDVFKIEVGDIFNDIAQMQNAAENTHKEVLELISTLSDGTTSDRSSSIYHTANPSQPNSSNSFSMLPSKPKIFHGRDSELGEIVECLNQETARIAILGAGGMGKTSLARAVLHHPTIVDRYKDSLFVPCDSATSSIELAASLGSHLGLKPGKDLTKPVIQYFLRRPPCLLILDNLETPWEPTESRGGVEEFLSLLTDIPHLALIITMRGAERPAKVRWTHPFLLPLKPLTDEAARQTFIDIADDSHDLKDIDQLLSLTDNMPLAVELIAHLVDIEGCANILARWETERTSLLSAGHDRRSNLDASITVSLSSPRIISLPGAKDLLSLLEILPDGLSDVELIQGNLSIPDVLACKAALLRTALGYIDDQKRLKILMPIREYMQHIYPPMPVLVQPLRNHFHSLLDLYQNYKGIERAGVVPQITANVGNIHQVLLRALYPDTPDISDVIKCTLSFNGFRRVYGQDQIPSLFPRPCDHKLEAQFITEVLNSHTYRPMADPELLICEALSHFNNSPDAVLEYRFYDAVGSYYAYRKNDFPAAMRSFEKAVSFTSSSGDPRHQSVALNTIAWLNWRVGDISAAQMYAHQAQRLAKLAGTLSEEAKALWIDSLCSTTFGDYKDTVNVLERAKELLVLGGMSGSHLHLGVVNSEAEVHLLKSEYAETRIIYNQILHDTSADDNEYNHTLVLLNIADIAVMTGAKEQDVLKNLDRATEIFSRLQFSAEVTACECTLGFLKLREGDSLAAKMLFQRGLIASWGTDPENVSYCLQNLADTSNWTGSDFEWSSQWTVVYLAYAQKSHQRLALYNALAFLGKVFLANGDRYTAHSLFSAALDGFTHMDIHRRRGDSMLHLGDIAEQEGDLALARKLWREARPLFERSLQAKDMARIDTRLNAVNSDGNERI